MLIVVYYSRFIEIALLKQTTAKEKFIRNTKSTFARHGIPEVVVSDNGPQFVSDAHQQFAKDYHSTHKASSQYYPQSNGEAERAVGTIKRLLNKKKGILTLPFFLTGPLLYTMVIAPQNS